MTLKDFVQTINTDFFKSYLIFLYNTIKPVQITFRENAHNMNKKNLKFFQKFQLKRFVHDLENVPSRISFNMDLEEQILSVNYNWPKSSDSESETWLALFDLPLSLFEEKLDLTKIKEFYEKKVRERDEVTVKYYITNCRKSRKKSSNVRSE